MKSSNYVIFNKQISIKMYNNSAHWVLFSIAPRFCPIPWNPHGLQPKVEAPYRLYLAEN